MTKLDCLPPTTPRIALCMAFTIAALALAACGGKARFGEVHLSARAASASVSGVTAPENPAVGLAEGCAGHIASSPEHSIIVREIEKVVVTARSDRGPLVLVAKRDGQTLCSTDNNEGLRPELSLPGEGTYAVYVGSLQSMEELPYQLDVAPAGKEAAEAQVSGEAISVSVTSAPSGATVTSPGGELLGKTPTILLLAPGETEAKLVVAMAGYKSQELHGTATSEELRLHATLERAGPRKLMAAATQPVPIEDYKTATQQASIEEACTIKEIEVDVAITHSYIADLLVELVGPQGQKALLHRGGRGRANLERTYSSKRFRALRRFVDTNPRGTWSLTVRDREEEDQGTLNSFALRITCSELDN